MMATCLLVAIAVFNVGQTVSEKMRITNTADAAVYSGAVWQARTLNFQAYTNRAMIANEVAIAQTISLISWLRYVDQTAKNIPDIASWNPAMDAAMAAVGANVTDMNAALIKAAPDIITSLSAINHDVLSSSQDMVHNAGFMASSEVINAVIKANDSNARQTTASKALFATYESDYENFTKNFSGSYRTRMRTIVNRSLDKFIKRRSRSDSAKSIEYKKRGGVSMVGLDKWEAFDALSSYHRECDSTGCEWKENTPIGWGGAKSEKNISDTTLGTYGSAKVNSSAFELAKAKQSVIAGYKGMPVSRDVRDTKLRDNDAQTLKLAIEVAKPSSKFHTSSGDGIGVDRLRQENGYAGNEISALAKAEVYFKYPDNQNYAAFSRKIEYANLYNPFWQARLIAPDSKTDVPAVLADKVK